MRVVSLLKLLDCTLRDGGYYTAWNFTPKLVDKYLSACATAGVDIVEIGLRNYAKEGFYGPFAYSTEDYLNKLNIPENICLGVMVDAKTLFREDRTPEQAIDDLFVSSTQSKVQLVRVAAHFNEVQKCGGILTKLKSLGYTVGINLMQASGKPAADVQEKINTLLTDCTPDVIYFADSLGNMEHQEVERLYQAIRSCWQGDIGIHTHNNKGLAVSNSLHAKVIGTTWLDATIQGMGRGAGNAEMELLMTELSNYPQYHAEALYPIVLNEFQQLKQAHQWGTNLLYYYSALHNIHPTYAQELLTEDRYSTEEKISIIKHLAELGANSYQKSHYRNALEQHFSEQQGSGNILQWCHGEDIVLVAAGPSSKQYADDIVAFAKRKNARLISVNVIAHIDSDTVDAVVTVDHNRIRYETASLHTLNKPILAPLQSMPEDCQQELTELEVLDFGLQVLPGEFAMSQNGCTLPHALSAVYGMCALLQGGAKHLYLAGFDGYQPGDERQTEMLVCLDKLDKQFDTEHKVSAITPTTYPIKQGSVYAP